MDAGKPRGGLKRPPENEQDNLTPAQLKVLKSIIESEFP